MSLWKAFKEAIEKNRKEKEIRDLTYKGLDMDSLKKVAEMNEKYIEIYLKDGTIIKIWREQDRPQFQPDPRIW
jgi:hypothetical protein